MGQNTLPFDCSFCGMTTQSATAPEKCAFCDEAHPKLGKHGNGVIQFVADPSHGWLVVTRERLASYGVTEGMISPYSYQSPDGLHVALEEDCDAAVFIQEFTTRHGMRPHFVEEYQSPCPIREWPSFGRKAHQQS